MGVYKLESKFKPTGDQPTAIASLVEGVESGLSHQVLLGVTGSGKTFTMANIIEQTGRPALIIAHNKTLAAQLCNEFREFFPHNRVEYFVSYYDYYQPESYLPTTDTFIEKDLQINEEIDKLRHSATCSLSERKDVIVIASVSCIYGLGAPEDYFRLSISIREGMELSRDDLISRLVEIQYKRSDMEFVRSTFRVRGDIVDIFPSYGTNIYYRVEFYGDEVDRIFECEAVSGKKINTVSHMAVFPATHYAFGYESMEGALRNIKYDMDEQVIKFNEENKLVEAQRLSQRTQYDIEMIQEMGYCNGIENYSRYFDGRSPGMPPFTLLDYFPDDFITFVDESHMTLPQIRAMFNGDFARKTNLVDYGFRLPSAFDNRPLKFDEFNERIGQVICVSATPAVYELEKADNIAEQLIRPTGLLDPMIDIRPIEGQVDDLIVEIKKTAEKNERVLVTTLTKKFSESLSTYLSEKGIKTRYMHSDIDTLERIEIINDLRKGEFDVLIGINLLREGLDIPEVSLVAILDADKEGFLRNVSSLIQTIGRAARNSEGRVIMYADTITKSIEKAVEETKRRRAIQDKYNKDNGIIPKTIKKDVKNTLEITKKVNAPKINIKDIPVEIEKLQALMEIYSNNLEFEKAIEIRESIRELKGKLAKHFRQRSK
ncbi:MAG: excinuclease ABC subunit UvrB [Bacillota bacterium]